MMFDLHDTDVGSEDTEPQYPPLIDLTDDGELEDEEEEVQQVHYTPHPNAYLGALASKINGCTHAVGELPENLSIILSLQEAQWDGQGFTGVPGEGIIEAIEAFFQQAPHRWAPSPPQHPEFGDDPVLMQKVANHLLQREQQDRPDRNALKRKNTILVQPRYRLMLVDWLVEVAVEWGLKPQTVHRAVVYVDRVFSNIPTFVTTSQVQLIGSTCLMLACKMEEVRQDSIMRFSKVTGDTYRPKTIEDMEQQITEVLGCRLSDVTITDFVLVYSKMLGLEDEAALQMCGVLADLALHELDLVAALPSLVAMSCIYVAVHLTHGDFEGYWESWMRRYFAHTPEEHQECVERVMELWKAYSEKNMGKELKYILLARLPGCQLAGWVPQIMWSRQESQQLPCISCP